MRSTSGRSAATLRPFLEFLQAIQNGPLVGLDPAAGQRFVGGSYANQQNVRQPDFAVADLNRHHDREHWRAAFAEIGRHEELLEPRGLHHARHEA